jgi:5'(3')-deoxyribonucleotidase
VRVLIDVDGVIVDFVSFYRAVATYALKREFEPAPQTQWDIGDSLSLTAKDKQVVHKALFEANSQAMQAYPGAIFAVSELLSMSDVDVRFVTAPLHMIEDGHVTGNSRWCYDRTVWLSRLFGPDVVHKMYFCHDKAGVVGDVFIDDKPDNVCAWAEANPDKQVFLWEHPYNVGEYYVNIHRTSSWKDVLDFVKEYKSSV